MFRIRVFWASGLLAALLAWPAAAQQDPAAAPEAAAVRAAADAYVEARSRGDREALLAAWTPEGDYIDAAGHKFRARDLIASEFSQGDEIPRSVSAVSVDSIRLITPQVAIQDGTTSHVGRGGEPLVTGRFTAVWVQADGRWLLHSLRESILPASARNTRLDELRWCLGVFAGQLDNGSDAIATASLSPDGNFILREVVVRHPDDTRHTVSQRIGWDPLSQAFKSWTFEGDGGYGEGSWKQQAGCWIVVTEGVTSDGRRTSGMSIYSQITEQGFILEFVGTMVEGAVQPDAKARFARQVQPE